MAGGKRISHIPRSLELLRGLGARAEKVEQPSYMIAGRRIPHHDPFGADVLALFPGSVVFVQVGTVAAMKAKARDWEETAAILDSRARPWVLGWSRNDDGHLQCEGIEFTRLGWEPLAL